MKLTEDMMCGNINDEYYYRESNVVLIITGNAEALKKQILDNQEKLEKIKDSLSNANPAFFDLTIRELEEILLN